MPAINHDFEVEQGALWEFTFIWEDGNGDPVQLDGKSAKMQIRTSSTSDTVLLEISTANGMITIDPSLGSISGIVGATKTKDLTKNGVYDLEIFGNDEDVVRFAQGKIIVSREVTK